MNVQMSPPSSLEALCGRCLYDTGHHCGMVGAARCELIDRWEAGERPPEWFERPGGRWSCSGFEEGLLPLDD